MTVNQIHAAVSNTLIYFFIALTLWGYWRFYRKQGIDSSFWGAIAIAEILVIAQFLLGAYLWILGFRPARSVHVLYGIVTLLALPGVYLYTKGRTEQPEMLMYSTVSLITIGLILRAVTTAELALITD